MKKKLALFLALCTLAGCANTTPAATTTSEISETTSVTTEITTPPPVTTTAQVTTAATEKTPPKYEGDMPELTAKNIPYTIEKRVIIDDLLEQIDIKPQIDITKLDGYESAVWFYENLATEDEKAYMTDNKYMRHFASLDYIGTELADWLLQIDYYFITDGQTPPEYMRLFYVKDGVVTKELQNIDFERYGAVHSDNTADFIYMSTWNNGIYEFNKHTGTLDNIISIDEWADVFTIDEKYLFFRAEDCLQICDRESGKVTKTDIYEGMYDGTAVKYNGEVLYYSEDDKYYCYDIDTGETSELSEFGVAAANLDYPWDMIGNSIIGKYHINTKYRTDKLVSMTVTVRESGTERNYIFEEIAQNFLNDGCVRANLRGEAYGMLCFTIDTYTGSYLFLLDPERNTIQYFNADKTDTFFLSAVADTLICYTDSGYYTVVPEIKYEKADLFPDEELYPVPSSEETKAMFCEIAEGVKYENEEVFPHQGHLELAKEICWKNERVQEQIKKAELPEGSLCVLPENMEDLTAEGLYHYDFDMDGENESLIHIQYLPVMSCGVLIYVDEDEAEIIAEETGGIEILVYDFDDFCYTQIAFYYGMTGTYTGIYNLRNSFSEPLVSGTNCEYENGVFYVYNKAEFTDYPVICCADGVFRQIGREEISRKDFETHVKNGAEYLNKLEAQYITINKIEAWGHYTYQLTCTERGADFGINITMRNINDIDDEAAYIRAPYEVAYEPKLTEEQIYGVDVWNLKDSSIIVPEVTIDNNVSKEKSFVHSNIETQLRTEKPVDASVYDWYDEIRAEAEEKGGEEAENAKKNNYTSIYIFNSQFIGNEKADWIVSTLYSPRTGGLIPSFLCRIFYVRDGKITQYLAEFESDCYIDSYDGRIFVSAYNDGIYELNLKTDKLEKIVDAAIISDEWPHQNFCRCFAATNEYMIYKDAEECLKIYYFDSGKIFKTDIYSGWHDGQAFIIRDDSLIYMPMNTDSNEYAKLDIMTGELNASDISDEEFWNLANYFKNENENWHIEPFEVYDLPDIITVKSKADGKIKNYDIKTALKEHGYDEKRFEAAGLDGDKFYCHSRSARCYLVLDLTQDTVRLIEQEDDNYHSVSFASSQLEIYDGEQNYILNINPPSFSDEKDMLTEGDSTGNATVLNFGRDTAVTVECNLIDKSLDCEKIILERAETLHRMIYDYLSYDEGTLVYSLGERCTKPGVFDTYKVISDEIKTYDDFKDMFSDEIYGPYIDYICSDTPRLLDIDGELYFHECLSGIIGIYETWYLGYEVTDYSIIGHFAALEGVPTLNEDHLNNKEYLNNEENYLFYDITVHNINGNYVLTGSPFTNTIPFFIDNHGMFYNSGKADRSLIYNEKVKPGKTGITTAAAD